MASSWFGDLAKTVQSSVSEATQALGSSVTDASSVLEKLTLTTPEMAAARQELEEAARSKQARKDQLAKLLPWETEDSDCQILVAECQTAILELSKHKSTFFGPFPLAPQPNTSGEDTVPKAKADESPSEESQTMLSQLHPLPKLLGDGFDMHMHVGLIEKLLTVDPQLVRMQSLHSGGGQREVHFWKNYFIHVAHCRYTAGLGIDEIWGDHVLLQKDTVKETQDEEKEEVVDFMVNAPGTMKDESPGSGTTESSGGYEMVAEAVASPENDDGAEDDADLDALDVSHDYELDELEAEIARELEED